MDDIKEQHHVPVEREKTDVSAKRPNWISVFIQKLKRRGSQRPDVSRLKQKVDELNNFETSMLPVAPLQHTDKVPIDLLYASVVIQEIKKYTIKRNFHEKLNDYEKAEIVVQSPTDLLYINGKLARRVYMVGDAAHGKTTYCLWLLKQWCSFQNFGSSSIKRNEWEKCLGQFDFVFFVKFRCINPSSVTLTQMIQQTLTDDPRLIEALEYVLGSEKYLCLLILDGLDEWNPHQDAIDQLRCKGKPNEGNILNCVVFTTMRLWKLESVAETLRENDRIVEIQGLDSNGFQTVTEKLLVNHYGLEKDSSEFEEMFFEIMKNTKDDTMRSFLKIPLLAVVCVQLWVKRKQVKDSMTSFYAAMVDLLVERAPATHETKRLEDEIVPRDLPEILKENTNIQSFLSILLKLGKIAYEGLLAGFQNNKLVFQKKKLEKEVGEKELQFALNVGLISQQEAESDTTRNISVHFFHKSLQEFLAALYIVTNKDVGDSFCRFMSNMNLIQEFSNVIMFICGFCPTLGCRLSENLVSLSSKDRTVLYFGKSQFEKYHTDQLYKMFVSWYKEIIHVRTLTDIKVTFHVSDIYVDHANLEKVIAFLTDRQVTIKTLFLEGYDRITNETLNDFLAYTSSLVELYVDGVDTDRTVHNVSISSIKYLQLFNIRTFVTPDETPFLSNMHSLRKVLLHGLVLGERTLGLSSHMTYLKEVTLRRVQMSARAWGLFVESLHDIQHGYSVELFETDIDAISKRKIISCPDFMVFFDSETTGFYCKRKFVFDRMCPETET